LNLDPKFDLGYYNLAHVLGAQKKYPAVIFYLKKAVALAPQQPVYQLGLGVAYLASGSYDEAVRSLDKLVAMAPDFAEADLNKVFYAPSKSAAPVALFSLKESWGRLFPSAVQILERDLDRLLTFFQFDATYGTVLRTTNPIERLNKEFKRRTKAMEVTGERRPLIAVFATSLKRWSIAGAFIPSLSGQLFTHKLPLDPSNGTHCCRAA
jgi:tetratricopeptide (TPR) repeat protein